MGLTTVERVLGCVRDYLEGAQSKILRCAIAVSTNIPENHEKKTSNTTHIKNIERKQIQWRIIAQFEMLFAIT